MRHLHSPSGSFSFNDRVPDPEKQPNDYCCPTKDLVNELKRLNISHLDNGRIQVSDRNINGLPDRNGYSILDKHYRVKKNRRWMWYKDWKKIFNKLMITQPLIPDQDPFLEELNEIIDSIVNDPNINIDENVKNVLVRGFKSLDKDYLFIGVKNYFSSNKYKMNEYARDLIEIQLDRLKLLIMGC